MIQKDLHEVIVDILQSSNKPLTVKEITDIISSNKLWCRPKDGKLPNATQVSARVNEYKNLFSRNGVVILKKAVKIEERSARLTYNKNGWIAPSGPEGKSKAKDSYETKNGYGHEEWLLDLTKTINGYHYGFLQPLNANLEKYVGSVFSIYLYSVNNTTKEKFWVGKINNAEVIGTETSMSIKKIYQANGWYQEMKAELKDLDLDEQSLDRWKGKYLFNIKFKFQDFEKYPERSIVARNDDAITSNRYVLLHVKSQPKIAIHADGNFVLGRCNPDRRFPGSTIKKTIEERIIEYPFIHHKISKALETTLRASYDEVYAEHETGFKTSIDLVAVKGKSKSFFEIKTYSDVKASIRQAVGQLLEYSYFPDRKLADKLYIVTQYELNDHKLISYMQNLRNKLKLPVYYMWYDTQKKKIGQII